tara:strand:+ start:224 stop:1141 length:918 start_codon:yes stop_codon:yes gene_type:complete
MNNTEENSHQHKSKLNLHICGGEHKVSTLEEVQEVTTPEVEYRKERNRDGSLSVSYRPIGHNLLIDKTRNHLDQAGFTIEGESHNLAREGKRYFGLFQVSHPDRESGERGTVVGLRNAHDKCFPAGLCAGDAPFVCDNLIFTNTVKLARRHTKNILSELDHVIARTLGRLFDFWVGQDNRIESYKGFELSNPQVNDLVIRAYKAGAIPKTKVTDVVDQWEKSDHSTFWDRNMNSLYNAFTEVYKGNLVALPKRSEALHSVLDSEVGFDLSSFDSQIEEAELVEVGEPQATEVLGNINGEVPADLY